MSTENQLGEITPEIKQAYRLSPHTVLEDRLQKALRDQLAARLREEFLADHAHCVFDDCRSIEIFARRHLWTDADWQALAEKELSEP